MALLFPPFRKPHRDKYYFAYLLLTMPVFQIEALAISSVGAPLNVLGSCELGDSFRVKLWWGASISTPFSFTFQVNADVPVQREHQSERLEVH